MNANFTRNCVILPQKKDVTAYVTPEIHKIRLCLELRPGLRSQKKLTALRSRQKGSKTPLLRIPPYGGYAFAPLHKFPGRQHQWRRASGRQGNCPLYT